MKIRLLLTACAVLGLGACTSPIEEEGPPEPIDAPLPTATSPIPTNTPARQPIVLLTEDGFRIVYLGPVEAQVGGALEAAFQVLGPDGQPAQGTFFATLGDPPSDSRASHANGQLDQEGKISLMLGVNWPAGLTKLYCAFQDQVYEVAQIVINP